MTTEENQCVYLTQVEVTKILHTLKSNHLHKIWFMMVYSLGINLKELTSIKIQDISEKDGNIRIVFGKHLRHRILPLPATLQRELRHLAEGRSSDEYLFQGRGKAVHPRTVQKAFEKIGEQCGCKISFAILRRTIAIHLLQKGWEYKSVVSFLGHSAYRSTRRLVGLQDIPPSVALPLDEILGRPQKFVRV
jgi:integrase/recombinase XerD